MGAFTGSLAWRKHDTADGAHRKHSETGRIDRRSSIFRMRALSEQELDALYNSATRDTIQRFEATGSPVITDGEQRNKALPPIRSRAEECSPDGMPLLFADGHIRNFPRLIDGPFRYRTPADVYLDIAQRYAAFRSSKQSYRPPR